MADEKAIEFFESFEDDLNDGKCTNNQLKQMKEVVNDFLGSYTPNLWVSPFNEVYFCLSKCKNYKANRQKYCRKPKLVEQEYLILQILFFVSYLMFSYIYCVLFHILFSITHFIFCCRFHFLLHI